MQVNMSGFVKKIITTDKENMLPFRASSTVQHYTAAALGTRHSRELAQSAIHLGCCFLLWLGGENCHSIQISVSIHKVAGIFERGVSKFWRETRGVLKSISAFGGGVFFFFHILSLSHDSIPILFHSWIFTIIYL